MSPFTRERPLSSNSKPDQEQQNKRRLSGLRFAFQLCSSAAVSDSFLLNSRSAST